MSRNLLIKPLVASCMALLFGVSNITAQDNGHTTYWNQQETLFQELKTHPGDIVMLGNSITDGGEWQEILNNTHVVNRGISGDTTQGILDRLTTVTKGQPEKIFLMIGTNDLSHGLSVEQVCTNIEQIIQRIQKESPNTEIYIQSVLPVSNLLPQFEAHKKRASDIITLNKLIEASCKEAGVTYIDLYSHFVADDGKLDLKYTNDGLHLLGSGYLLWASIIKPYID